MTIKILRLLDSLNRGGAEILELDICRNAASAGLDLTFAATGGGDLEADFAASGVDYVRLERKLPVDPFLIKQLRDLIKSRNINIVHANQPVEAIHGYLAASGTGAKCVMTLHNRLMDRRNRLAARLVIPRMDAVVSVSRSTQEWYAAEEGFVIDERFHILPNGVDIKRLAPAASEDTTRLRREFGINENAALLGMIGNFYLDGRKDQLTVCGALPAVFEQFPEAHFVFIGALHDGAEGYHERCVEYCRDNDIADRVHFVGKRGDIPDLLRELDLFVFSTVQEGMPIAAIEALMLGVPMIVSDILPMLEVGGADTAEGLCVEVFETGNADDLAEKVIALLRDPDKLTTLGEKARVQTTKYYGIEAHLATLKSLYENLAAGK